MACRAPDFSPGTLRGPRCRFTGSAATGAHLRQHRSVVHGGVQLGIEADSLNCSTLGTDATVEDPEFDLLVKGVVAEMTVKAGHKCAAIRQREEVRKAIQALAASADIVFGDPNSVDLVDADAEKGAFMSPVLLRARTGATEPHNIEPFGPVATVLTYNGWTRRSRSRPVARAAWSAP